MTLSEIDDLIKARAGREPTEYQERVQREADADFWADALPTVVAIVSYLLFCLLIWLATHD